MKILVSAAVLCLGAVSFSSLAAQWYVAGPAIGETSIELEQNDEGLFVLELAELPNTGFYFHDEGESKFLGSESFNGSPIEIGTVYTLSSMGYDIRLADNVSKVKDAVIELNPDASTLVLNGTPEIGQGTGSGPVTGDKSLKIMPEPGSASNRFGEFTLTFEGYESVTILDPAMYDPMFGPVTFTEMSTGKVYSRGGAQPLPFVSNSIPVQLGQTIFNREYVTEAGTEDSEDLPYYEEHDMLRENGKYVLDIPAGSFELKNGDETVASEAMSFVYILGPKEASPVTVVPAPETASNRFGEFTLTFEGYESVTILDPAMYDPMFGPVTFTEMSTGKVYSRGGAQPLPFVSNSIPVQLGQTIFNREYVTEAGTEDSEDLPYYEEHDMLRENGKYVLDIPAGSFELKNGDETVASEAMSFVYTLGTSLTGISTLAPQYQGRDIYTLNGVLVVRNASAEDIDALPAGIYVMGGRKIARK